MLDVTGACVDVTGQWESVIGAAAETMIGHRLSEWLYMVGPESLDDVFERVRIDGVARRELNVWSLHGGEPGTTHALRFNLSVSLRPSENPSGWTTVVTVVPTAAAPATAVGSHDWSMLLRGIGKDMNNLFGLMQLQFDLLAEDIKTIAPNASTDVEDITEVMQRALRVSRQVQQLGRQVEDPLSTQLQRMNIGEALSDSASFFRRVAGESATLSLDISPQSPRVWMSSNLLDQVVLNLVKNARDAVEGEDPARRMIHVSLSHDDSRVVISVSDTGHGIAENVLPNVVDPHFSTRENVHGTRGRGLSNVERLLEHVKGHMQIYSVSGHGTMVRCILPVASESHSVVTSETPASWLALTSPDLAQGWAADMPPSGKVVTTADELRTELLRGWPLGLIIDRTMIPDVSSVIHPLLASRIAEPEPSGLQKVLPSLMSTVGSRRYPVGQISSAPSSFSARS